MPKPLPSAISEDEVSTATYERIRAESLRKHRGLGAVRTWQAARSLLDPATQPLLRRGLVCAGSGERIGTAPIQPA
jgi:hypothetical protein